MLFVEEKKKSLIANGFHKAKKAKELKNPNPILFNLTTVCLYTVGMLLLF
jgi:hypothetical protein